MIKEMGRGTSDSMVERFAHLAPEHLARHAAVIDDWLRTGGHGQPLVVAKCPRRWSDAVPDRATLLKQRQSSAGSAVRL